MAAGSIFGTHFVGIFPLEEGYSTCAAIRPDAGCTSPNVHVCSVMVRLSNSFFLPASFPSSPPASKVSRVPSRTGTALAEMSSGSLRRAILAIVDTFVEMVSEKRCI